MLVTLFGKVALLLGGVATLTDAAWALPINTFLLLLIAVINMRNGRKVNQVADNVAGVHETATFGAQAAASAAASAADSARITKELGGALRAGAREPVVTPAPPADKPGGGA